MDGGLENRCVSCVYGAPDDRRMCPKHVGLRIHQ